MKRAAAVLLGALASLALFATPAGASFGLSHFEVEVTDSNGSPATEAGTHPFALTTFVAFNHTGDGTSAIPDGKARDVIAEQTAGLVADLTGVKTCSTADFLIDKPVEPTCPLDSVVGIQTAAFANTDFFEAPLPVFLMPPPPGAAARLGWKVHGVPVVVDLGIKQAPEYNGFAASRGINQTLSVFGFIVELWGVPADSGHDALRGNDCAPAAGVPADLAAAIAGERITPSGFSCPATGSEVPFLTLPRRCGSAITRYEARSWQEPGVWLSGEHAGPELTGCDKPAAIFSPSVDSKATADSTETASGLDFSIEFDDEGLKSADGTAQSEIEKTVVRLPEGMTVNPSIAEGLGVCTPADLDRETLAAEAGEGCPNASKVGTVHVVSPLVDEPVDGSVYIAQQDDPATSAKGAENPFDSLIAFYIVLKNRSLGILVKQPAKVEPDPRTGQLVTTVDDIPQIPFSSFEFHFREGQRAPLVTPAACGTHTTEVQLTPRADPSQVRTESSSFQITRGASGGPCPAAGVPPFAPGFLAGALNNSAGSFSPFAMELTRRDGDQDLTRFSAVLPPGVVGKLAGVGRCSDTAIAIARGRSGREELASASCPVSSKIGEIEAGAGVGSALTYVPGSLYLAGPYNGAPLSVVAITPAVAGPFDAGTVVVRVALDLDPVTGQVRVDGAASDAIPHILKGIVLKLRDLWVDVNRHQFTLNPTSCDPSATVATLFGSFADVLDPADDVPVARSSRHQIANCWRLGFKPRLAIGLKGGVRRGAHPALRAVVRPRPGDANFSRAAVTLPRSAFLDQAHIRTICTRVQFAAGPGNGALCPKGARYGYARAWSPLLDAPAQGPVYLRSSDNNLPDLVVALKGPASAPVEVELSARIDSVRGGIRSIFAAVPDLPVSRFVLNMQGGKKGLIVNSRHLCFKPKRNRARANLRGQNGRFSKTKPRVIAVTCAKRRKAKKRRNAKRAQVSRAMIADRSASRR